ncbi:hypothetical protein A9798_06220 [Edwardsiella hoshinae]|uniref:Uncharacterized protein n=1 Tax=Edwardsiella hoshinae TaxID=93378 RepID=A0A376DDT0_9GAMM|nr:hypothetical protein [Edwardsiella hoshinae]AOV96586.1 hypothetical protein A9798_06220 [Edwardsiella hoshinae]QPR27521.1 hypothetical protein I6G97_14000 [Edwardsiella hoshinae]STC86993.1 Uncharacterised protein [Edwardsiella hoshinae]
MSWSRLRRHPRLVSLLAALLSIELQVVLFDALAKPQNVALNGNPLETISMLGFFFAWTTGLNAPAALLAGAACLLPLPLAVYLACQHWLRRTR